MRKKLFIIIPLIAILGFFIRALKVVEFSQVEYVASDVAKNVGVVDIAIFPSEITISDGFFKKKIRQGAPLIMAARFDPLIHGSTSAWELEISSPVLNSKKTSSFSTSASDAYGKIGVLDLIVLTEEVDVFFIRIIADGKEIYLARYHAANRRTETFNELLARILSV